MIIGVDAGALSITDDRLKVGVWRITYNLLKQLSTLDTKNSYRLYSFIPLDPALLKDFGTRMTNVVLPQKGWFKVWLPLELVKNPIDIFLGLSQTIPSSRAENVGFVYDLGFLFHPELYPNSAKKLFDQTRNLLERSNHIVTISHKTAKDIMDRFGTLEDHIIVSYPGIDARFMSKGTIYKGEHPYFLFVGALKRGKNVPLLIRGFAEFLKSTNKVYDLILIGGDYWLDPEIDSTIADLHIERRVRRLGFVKDAEVPKYYRGAVALVSPSLVEGFCLPVAEAMASGCPVIVSSAGSLPEIVGDAGLLVDPQDPSTISIAMKQFTGEFSVRKKYIDRGEKKAKEYSWQTMAQSVHELISSRP